MWWGREQPGHHCGHFAGAIDSRSTGGVAQRNSWHCQQWCGFHLELVFYECEQLYGLGRLVWKRADQRQCEYGSTECLDDL